MKPTRNARRSPAHAPECGLSRCRPRWRRLVAMTAGMWVAGTTGQAQTITQPLQLRPGWNAVHLEVALANDAPATVFAGVPVESVWTRAETISSAEFIQDPSEALFNRSGWLVWFAPGRPDAFLSNLRALPPHRAYLIKLGGTAPITLTLEGSPAFRPPVWVPDAYTLQGFPVDEAAPPTFGEYFRASPAHQDPAIGPGSVEVHRLVNDQWTRVAPDETIRRGEAYWVFTRGASDYAGPLRLRVEFGDGLRFADTLSELALDYANVGSQPLRFRLEEAGAAAGALSYHRFDPVEGNQWLPLTQARTIACPAGQGGRIRLAIRRRNMAPDGYATVLRVEDGAGSLWRIPVTAEHPSWAASQALARASRGGGSVPEAVRRRAGLWFGSATIDAVSEVHSDASEVPTPTRSTFHLRLLIHLDGQGQARLLRQVIQMWRDGTTRPDAEGGLEMVTPGRHVLLTDDGLIGRFQGAALRDGTPVGRRFSAVGYDFAGTTDPNALPLAGQFELGRVLRGTLAVPVNHPTNPYLHRYHPDHDNLTARFDAPKAEAFAIERALELEFTVDPPRKDAAPPDYGYDRMGGIYRETITGLHKDPLHLSGTFSLRRISLVDALNPDPNL